MKVELRELKPGEEFYCPEFKSKHLLIGGFTETYKKFPTDAISTVILESGELGYPPYTVFSFCLDFEVEPIGRALERLSKPKTVPLSSLKTGDHFKFRAEQNFTLVKMAANEGAGPIALEKGVCFVMGGKGLIGPFVYAYSNDMQVYPVEEAENE